MKIIKSKAFGAVYQGDVFFCSNCNEAKKRLIEVATKYQEDPIALCRSCLVKAISMLDKESESQPPPK